MDLSLDEYLAWRYKRPGIMPELPLKDAAYVRKWQEGENLPVQVLLQEKLDLPWESFQWARPAEIALSFVQTYVGRLPVLTLSHHGDFCALVSLVAGEPKPQDYIASVNACAVRSKSPKIPGHRVIVLNKAPYSNIAAERLNLTPTEWLDKSQKLRLRHEAAHQETLQLLGNMRNHLRDEIMADTLGQLAAFGNFSAERQRLFFGLQKGQDTCTGRLVHYSRRLSPEDRPRLYLYVSELLDKLEQEVKTWQEANLDELEILLRLACDVDY